MWAVDWVLWITKRLCGWFLFFVAVPSAKRFDFDVDLAERERTSSCQGPLATAVAVRFDAKIHRSGGTQHL